MCGGTGHLLQTGQRVLDVAEAAVDLSDVVDPFDGADHPPGVRNGPPGLFFVERFDSMATVERFQAEMEEQGLIKLRQQVAKMHFLMALPAYTDANRN